MSDRATRGPGGRVARRLADLHERGVDALEVLPDREELAADAAARRQTLEGLRVELYALSAMVADATVRRALHRRRTYPPYGLGKSMFSDWGMVKVRPDPYEEGSITSFYRLWKALVDTTVLHLHLQLSAQRHRDDAWVVERLDRLVALFAVGADAKTAARTRDTQTFLYGGLQFGTSVSVQLAEVMSRLLAPDVPDPAEQRTIMARSVVPAHRLAAMSLEQALDVYRSLLSTAPDTPSEGRKRPGWLDAARFAVQEHDGAPYRVVLREEHDGEDVTATYPTLGCPARVAAAGEQTPITALWEWCVDVAHDTGLLVGRG